jgi:hypothetical protein
MIYFLEPGHSLVELRLDVTACPTQAPLLLPFIYLSETVIFQGVANQSDSNIVIVLEVVTLISRLVGSDTDRINIGSKNQVPVWIV